MYKYHTKLIEITDKVVPGDGTICSWPLSASECAAEQLRLLNDWISASNLPRIDDLRQALATDISPIGLFEKVKLDLRDLGNTPHHAEYRHYRPCGLKRLATEIINPKGNDRLARWIMRTGGKAPFTTEEHIEYMKARRKKYKQLSFDWACAIAD